jgi:pimeloyl-ACP methyl ester carboxylesterase
LPIVRGVEIAVCEVDAHLAGGHEPRPAVMWGHGFSGSVDQDQQTPILDWPRLSHRYRVVKWDARGHGRSGGGPDPDEYRWDNLARDLTGLADTLGIERFVAGGVSMGAATALHAAALFPERIAGMVLALAPTAYATRAAQADRYRAGAELVEREGIEAYVQAVNAEPVPGILSRFAASYRFSPTVPEHLLPAALRGAAASDLPAENAVGAIAAPALLLAWDTDPGHPVSTAERLVALLPNAELHVARRLRDVGTWTDRVESFLGAVAPAGVL